MEFKENVRIKTLRNVGVEIVRKFPFLFFFLISKEIVSANGMKTKSYCNLLSTINRRKRKIIYFRRPGGPAILVAVSDPG